MKKQIYYFALIAVMLGMCFTSCRDDSTEIKPYSHNDEISFKEAEKSFASQFECIWKAMNSNYGIWDYEKSLGLDWDNVHEKYLPRFEELDRNYKKGTNPVPDNVLQDLYNEVFAPIHDGHFLAQVRNLHTGKYFYISPSSMRHNQIEDEDKYKFDPDIDRIKINGKKTGAVDSMSTAQTAPSTYETEAEFILASLEYDTLEIWNMYDEWEKRGDDQITKQHMEFLQNDLMDWVKLAQGYFKNNDDKPEDQINKYQKYVEITKKTPGNVLDNDLNIDVDGEKFYIPVNGANDYNANTLGNNLQQINMTSYFVERSALIEGNIPYIRINSFSMYNFMNEEIMRTTVKCREMSYLCMRARHTWEKWFNNVQKLSKENKLKGVIIDLRSNGGGSVGDFQYLAGALIPQDQCCIGYTRYKNGPGRFDYAPLTPHYYDALKQEHVAVTQPIVCLTNTHSVSMAEMTSKVVSYQPNGYTVGTKTWGGMSALWDDEHYNSTYASSVGTDGKTPFYLYIPGFVVLDRNKHVMEGIGVVPLEENNLKFDVKLYESEERDNQLERALTLINNGK